MAKGVYVPWEEESIVTGRVTIVEFDKSLVGDIHKQRHYFEVKKVDGMIFVSPYGNFDCIISRMDGIVVENGSTSDSKIDISQLPHGVYHLKLRSKKEVECSDCLVKHYGLRGFIK